MKPGQEVGKAPQAVQVPLETLPKILFGGGIFDIWRKYIMIGPSGNPAKNIVWGWNI